MIAVPIRLSKDGCGGVTCLGSSLFASGLSQGLGRFPEKSRALAKWMVVA